MKTTPITPRHLAAVLAAACAVAGCNRSDPARRTGTADVPIADAESTEYARTGSATDRHTPSSVDADVFEEDIAPADDGADDPGRDAALRYMGGGNGAAVVDDGSPAAASAPGHTAQPPIRRPDASETRAADAPQASRTARAGEAERADPPPAQDVAAARGAGDTGLARSLNQEGIALIGAGRPEQAIVALERAVRLQPRDAEMLGNLGYAYMLAGRHRSARTTLQSALDIAPGRSATWLNLGQTYAELGERDVAIDAVLKGYRYSSRKASVRSALERAASGRRHSPAWRETAAIALDRIG